MTEKIRQRLTLLLCKTIPYLQMLTETLIPIGERFIWKMLLIAIFVYSPHHFANSSAGHPQDARIL